MLLAIRLMAKVGPDWSVYTVHVLVMSGHSAWFVCVIVTVMYKWFSSCHYMLTSVDMILS